MSTTVQILTTNYSGQTATITFSPCSGGTINLGSHVIPYNYISDNYLGDYSLYFTGFSETCTFSIPCTTATPTPTVIIATATPTPTVIIATATPTPTPTNTETPLPATETPTPTPTITGTTIPTATPTVVSYSYQIDISGHFLNPYDACLNQTVNYTVYSAYPTLNVSNILYTNSNLTSEYGAGIGNYFIIEDGINKFVIDSDVNGFGINSITNCVDVFAPTPTPTPTSTPEPTQVLYTYGINYTENPTPYEACQLSSPIDSVYTTDLNPLTGSTIFYYDQTLTSPYTTTNNGYYSTLINENNDVFALTTDITTGVVIGFVSCATVSGPTPTPTPTTTPLPATDTPTPSPTPCPEPGTVLRTFCDGIDLREEIAGGPGGCGYVNYVIEYNAIVCGGSGPTLTPTPTPTTTPLPATDTPTPSPTPIPTCYLYEVFADDGTSNKNSYSFSYVNCAGTTINSSVVNLESRTVCAREGSITSESPFISDGGEGAICGSDPTQVPTNVPTDTPTPTPLPATDTPTPTPFPPTDTPTPTPVPNAPTDTPTPTPLPPTATPTPTSTPIPTCYLYEVSADDGTSNKTSYSFSYVSCTGATINSSVVNLGERTVCAREGSVYGDGPISVSIEGAICGSDPTQIPTNVPTVTPEPTNVPTVTPEPTNVPTQEPTNVPTQEPTNVPTLEPTNVPTVTPEPTLPPTATPPPPTATPTPEPTGYTIDWSFSQGANSGDFSINVNSVQVVYATSNGSGQITVVPGASIITSVGAGTQSPLIAQAELAVNDNGTTLYNSSSQGTPFAGESYGAYPATGNGSISATASQF